MPVTNVTSYWSGGKLIFADKATLTTLLEFDGPNLTLSTGSGVSLILNGTTLNATEMGYLDGITPGTVAASKAVVVDSAKNFASLNTGSMSILKLALANSNDFTLTANANNVILTNVKTSDPSVAGALWSNSGVLSVSGS